MARRRRRHVALEQRRRHGEAVAGEVAQERVVQRRPGERRGDPRPGRAVGRVGGEDRRSRRPSTASSSRNCADWKPLDASRRPRKPVNWRGVIVSSTSIWATTTLRIVSTRRSVCTHRRRVAGLEQRLGVAELVEQLLEPQLVDLVDDDEQQLVVLVRARPLGAEHLVERQVAGVGQRGVAGRGIRHRRRWYVSVRLVTIGAPRSVAAVLALILEHDRLPDPRSPAHPGRDRRLRTAVHLPVAAARRRRRRRSPSCTCGWCCLRWRCRGCSAWASSACPTSRGRCPRRGSCWR